MEPSISKDDSAFSLKLKNIECPFTWDMDDVDKTVDTNYKPHDEEDTIIILKLMRVVMKIFENTNADEDSEKIFRDLGICDDLYLSLMKQPDEFLSSSVVFHILQATKIHVFYKYNEIDKAKNLLNDINEIDTHNKDEISTLNGCKSICWSKYHMLGKTNAVDYIRKAIAQNPYHIWYFILGKNLRRMRRDLSVAAQPNEEESEAFLKAYQISKNPVYGIFVAQMLREHRNEYEAIETYKDILNSNPKSCTIYLRLALGFMQIKGARNLKLAKICLDKVALQIPEDSMYLHYRGRYYLKRKYFTKAAYFLEKSANTGNYYAAKDYLRAKILNNNFNVIDYLLNLINQFQHLSESQLQNLFLDIAFAFINKQDLKNTLKYLLMAIEIDPRSLALLKHYSVFEPGREINVYYKLKDYVFPEVEHKRQTLDEKSLENYEELKVYYKDHLEKDTILIQNVMFNIGK